jgi:predicted nucleotidyltransferase
MQPTSYPVVNAILNRLQLRLKEILGQKLVGIYLYGSLVTESFDLEISDIDLLVVTSSALDEEELAALQAMHDNLATENPKWNERIEVAYLTLTALKTFRSQESTIAIISPGEPFHTKEAGKDWLINWYVVREKGLTLFGPAPNALIDPITQDEFIETVRDHIKEWPIYVNDCRARGSQAYAILTMCRALYTSMHGEQLPKRAAAFWAAKEFPAWSALIYNALWWREKSWEQDESVDHAATFPETKHFVHFAVDQIASHQNP